MQTPQDWVEHEFPNLKGKGGIEYELTSLTQKTTTASAWAAGDTRGGGGLPLLFRTGLNLCPQLTP